MFFEPQNRGQHLRHDPFKAIVAPRPIGWITTISANGDVNLAPYSYFNAVSTSPPIVMFSSDGWKDTIAFVEETRQFVCSVATWDLRHQMNATATPFPRGVNEMRQVGLEPEASVLVQPPRVKESPCALECVWLQTVQLEDVEGKRIPSYVAFGQVVGIYIDDRFLKDGRLDTAAMRPIARAGYHDYVVATPDVMFSMGKPATT